MRLLDNMAHMLVRMFTGTQPRSMAPEILANMSISANNQDADAFAEGANELLDDAVRLVYDAKLSAMTHSRRREVKTMQADEMASWLYDMCMDMDSMADMPPLKARMMLSAACARHAKGFG